MPRATRKVSPAVAATAQGEGSNPSRVRKVTKRPAEDAPEEQVEVVPSKAPRTAKSKQPVVNGQNSGGTSKSTEPVASKQKVTPAKSKKAATASSSNPRPVVSGATLHCFGQNDCGQIGIECEKRKYPAVVQFSKNDQPCHPKFVAVACGGMHTLALEEDGTVWSFGLNDDRALGREAEEEEEMTKPGIVAVPGKVVQISAGDSHSAALTDDGKVYAWGVFRDDNGNYGLIPDDGGVVVRPNPELITAHLEVKVTKIKSGANHIAMLGEDGQLYTCGTGSQGQLGRSEPVVTKRVTRSMAQTGQEFPTSTKEYLLTPSIVKFGRNPKLSDIWTGEFSTYCQSQNGSDIYVCGLNNYAQLGIRVREEMQKNIIQKPTKITSFRGKVWKQIAAGQHHTVLLDKEGKVFTIGKNTDGRLGLGPETPGIEHYDEPQLVEGLAGKVCAQIASGTSTSYAVTAEGHLFAWGFGENYQLATGDEEDRNVPTRCCAKPNIHIEGKVMAVAAGGQHVAVTISLPTDINGNS